MNPTTTWSKDNLTYGWELLVIFINLTSLVDISIVIVEVYEFQCVTCVTWYDNLLSGFMGVSPSRQFTTIFYLVIIDLVQAEIKNCSIKSVTWPARPHNWRIMWIFGWELLLVSHYPAEFGGHMLFGSGDIIFLVAEEHDSICMLISNIIIFSKGHGGMLTHTKLHNKNSLDENISLSVQKRQSDAGRTRSE